MPSPWHELRKTMVESKCHKFVKIKTSSFLKEGMWYNVRNKIEHMFDVCSINAREGSMQ